MDSMQHMSIFFILGLLMIPTSDFSRITPVMHVFLKINLLYHTQDIQDNLEQESIGR